MSATAIMLGAFTVVIVIPTLVIAWLGWRRMRREER